MRALTPWAPLTNLRQEMDRLLERFPEPRWYGPGTTDAWAPTMDVSETRNAVVVKAEIPGVDEKDIEVSFHDGLLTIRGEKAEDKEEKDEEYHRMERRYGAFMRTVQLPAAVEAEKVTATFKHGLLTVTLPKAAKAKGATIPIKAA